MTRIFVSGSANLNLVIRENWYVGRGDLHHYFHPSNLCVRLMRSGGDKFANFTFLPFFHNNPNTLVHFKHPMERFSILSTPLSTIYDPTGINIKHISIKIT